jgi:uracil-DNA glycosylase
MSEIFPNVVNFIEHQIELYGDELVFDKYLLNAKTSMNDVMESVDWHDSNSLADFENNISNCMNCDLHKSRKNFVFGSGNPNADFMILGGAPGIEEDRLGEPFAGSANELLTKMLAAIDISKDSAYYANIVKCRPPQNQGPSSGEIECCTHYLMKQIELVNPKMIICLGPIAAKALLKNNDDFKSLRGQTFFLNKTSIVVTYHPAELLENASLKRDAWADLQRIQQLLS